MAKLTLSDPSNIQNETTFLNILAANNAATETAMEKTLSRDGTTPNQMETDLDMNSNQILNLPDATTEQEPATFGQLQDYIEALENGAVIDASFVTLGTHAQITNERVLTAGTNLSLVDGGAGNTVTLSLAGSDLNAYENLTTTGIVSRTGDGTVETRTVTGTANEINVANGDGVSANPTISLPSTLTFTGKTINGGTFNSANINALDNSFAIYDNVDNTKGLQFEVSGVTTGTTRTLTVPNANTTIVGTDATQTLTNKTLTAPVISTISNTGTLTLPTSTDTIVGRATTDTLTNKTISGASNTISNVPVSGLASQAAYTFVGNNTGSSASPTAVDIASLTTKASPTAADYVLISDQAASGAWKKVTADALGAVGSVASIGGATGAITLGGNLSMSGSILRSVPRGYSYGLTLSNDVTDVTNDIVIATGEAASDETTPQMMVLGSSLIKRLDANWAAGTNQGMRNSAAAITNTTYHIYLVSKANNTDVDIYAHTSAVAATVLTALQAETGGGSYVSARRIGSIIRSSGAIVEFTQRGNKFLLKAAPFSISTSSLGTSATLYTLQVPTGIQVDAMCVFQGGKSGAGGSPSIYVTSPDQTDNAASGTVYTFFCPNDTQNYYGSGAGLVRTNTSGQIRARSSVASTEFYVTQNGWVDDEI